MGLNLTQLVDYVNQDSRQFLLDSIYESNTAKALKDAGQVMVGVKGKTAIQTLTNTVLFQDATATCARTPAGSTTFGQYFVTPKPLKEQSNYCPKAMEQKWMNQYLSKGQTYTELLFGTEIMNDRAAEIASANEFLAWQGSVAYTGATPNLNMIDGYLTQIKAASAVTTNLNAVTGATVVEKLQAIYLAVSPKVRVQKDFIIWIGQDVYEEYLIALTNKNIFRATDDNTIYGTPGKFIVVNGLIGTRTIVAGRLRSFFMATDMIGEEDSAKMQYSIETTQIYVDFAWSLGVSITYPSELVIATV